MGTKVIKIMNISPREKAETEKWFFIAKWCKEKGISPMVKENFDRAAFEWAKENVFKEE